MLDPDPAIGAFLVPVLEEEGYKVTNIHRLEDATKLLSHRRFDLIIIEAFDQNNAFSFDPSFLTALRSLAVNTPILLCSIYLSTVSLRKGDFGLAEVIPKPFDLDKLLEKVNRLLGSTSV